jgi:hypothetical protein
MMGLTQIHPDRVTFLFPSGRKLAAMTELQLFFFEVKASDGSTHAAHVKAPDLVTQRTA